VVPGRRIVAIGSPKVLSGQQPAAQPEALEYLCDVLSRPRQGQLDALLVAVDRGAA